MKEINAQNIFITIGKLCIILLLGAGVGALLYYAPCLGAFTAWTIGLLIVARVVV